MNVKQLESPLKNNTNTTNDEHQWQTSDQFHSDTVADHSREVQTFKNIFGG